MQGGADPDCRRGMYWDEKYQNRDIYAWYQRLISLRKLYKSITEGEVVSYNADDMKGILEITRVLGEEKITVLFNCSNEQRDILQYKGMKELTKEMTFTGHLEPYETVVLEG